MSWQLVFWSFLLLVACAALMKLMTWTERTLGSAGVLKILARHERGLSVDELLAWRAENWQQDIDTYPNIPDNHDACERLLEWLCAQGAVRSAGDGPDRRYFRALATDASPA